MWQYIKGILYGLFLLWLLLFLCLTISNGVWEAFIYLNTVVVAAFRLLQTVTHGTGIFIVLFVILSSWIWSFGKVRRARLAAPGPVPVGTVLVSEAQPVTTEAGLVSKEK